MYPAAGMIIWVLLGGVVGWLSGKITRTDGQHGTMANLGVGALAAVVAGFVTTVAFEGERSTTGFWMAIWISGCAALVAVAVFRRLNRGRTATIR